MKKGAPGPFKRNITDFQAPQSRVPADVCTCFTICFTICLFTYVSFNLGVQIRCAPWGLPRIFARGRDLLGKRGETAVSGGKERTERRGEERRGEERTRKGNSARSLCDCEAAAHLRL